MFTSGVYPPVPPIPTPVRTHACAGTSTHTLRWGQCYAVMDLMRGFGTRRMSAAYLQDRACVLRSMDRRLRALSDARSRAGGLTMLTGIDGVQVRSRGAHPLMTSVTPKI